MQRNFSLLIHFWSPPNLLFLSTYSAKILSTSDLAALFEVSAQTIINWSKTWLAEAKTGRGEFDIKKVYGLYLKNFIEPQYVTKGDLDSIDHARRRYENARAQKWEMDIEIKKGLLIPISEVEKKFANRIAVLKSSMLHLSRRIAKQLGNQKDAQELLNKEFMAMHKNYGRGIFKISPKFKTVKQFIGE